MLATCYHPPHRRTPEADLSPGEKRPDRLTLHQKPAEGEPASPELFSPDSGTPLPIEAGRPVVEIREEIIRTEEIPLPPAQFNPDTGDLTTGLLPARKEDADAGSARPDGERAPGTGEIKPGGDGFFRDLGGAGDEDFFKRDAGALKAGPSYAPMIPEDLQLPRADVEQRVLEAQVLPARDEWEPFEPEIAGEFQLPRDEVRYEEHIYEHWHAGHYQDVEYPPFTKAVADRWRIPPGKWDRYPDDRTAETPYEEPTPYLWHPYFQSTLKGDVPIIGQDIFASLTLQNTTDVEVRDLPTPSGVSTARPFSSEFYGRGDQTVINSNTGITFEIFRGETSFRPVDWLFRIQPVFNVNYISAHETTLVAADPRGLGQSSNPAPDFFDPDLIGDLDPSDIDDFLDPLLMPSLTDLYQTRATERTETRVALQQFFFESHLLDLSENYDFAAARIGTQIFNADFRGHVFFDANWGYRLFGNLGKNRLQYNLAFFDLFEKESFSELNTWDDRNQNVFIANLYWQDFLFKGYTTQFNFLANWDRGSDLIFDSAGNIVRPSPIGTIAPHDVSAYYLGWNGEGHIGRANISHSLYHVFGEDDLNGIAGREVDISAWMAALELSVDIDWMRHKLVLFYASGDEDATDGKAEGWDSIIDNPNFIGGPFSYWQRQGPNLGGTAVLLTQRLSLLPNLRSNKFLGQSNFVNPGIFIAGLGEEWEVTPKTRFFANLNYLMFMETDAIATALVTEDIDREIGWDLSFGVEYRPFLTENLKLNAGVGLLFTGAAFEDIYRKSTPAVPGFTPFPDGGDDDLLYSGFITATSTF
ncbi:hypothetical protein OKA05_21660 [Luteolibacter arcticus]|uniref:Alginate export domain-containing protein n=1 Tax=Luteolibacter arcticus TaxID=1581411 RepID=A0ABT3GNU7_9BACT|nr:hypothetical protein [Luteolibacter arcticus]MCW1925182.1 hypothetical protein [Luteolibacter arcticus]